MPERYLDRAEAAAYLGNLGLKTSPKTLQKYASVGGGPSYRRFGYRAVYTASDLNAWATSRLSAPMSSAGEIAQ
jgi:hypothetical protein